jgi:hypothetical protein
MQTPPSHTIYKINVNIILSTHIYLERGRNFVERNRLEDQRIDGLILAFMSEVAL